MSDNLTVTTAANPVVPPSGTGFSTREASFSGDTVQVPVTALATVTGAEGASTATDVGPTNPLPVTSYPVASGGGSDYHAVAASSNNAASIKGSAGQVYGVQVFNIAAYPVFVKLYNKATAPNPAVDTPVRTIGCQAGVRVDDDIDKGLAFSLGIGIAIVKGIADNDNTAVVASDCVVDVDYK